MKRLGILVAAVVGVVIVAVLLLPLFVNVDTFRPQLEKRLSAALNRDVQIGKITASLLSGGARADKISISDDPAFSRSPFLQASSLQIGLKWIPLVFSRQIKVTSITIEKPQISLLKNTAGKWNYSSLGSASPQKPAENQGGHAPDISVEKLEILNGQVRIGQAGGRAAQTQVYENVELLVNNISATTAMPFTMRANTPGGGSLELTGQAGPLNHNDASRTPLQAQLNLEHADLKAIGALDPDSALGGVVDVKGSLKSDGRTVHLEGTATGNGLRLVKGAQPARQPVSVDYRTDYGLETRSGTLDAKLRTGGSTVNTSGTLSAEGNTTMARLKLRGESVAVNDVEGLLPAVGVILPAGASLQGGTINMNMNAEGPLDRLVITGPLNISGTRLSGYNLSSKLGAIAAFTGIKPSTETVIQTFSTSLRVAPEGTQADNIVLNVPTIGELSGNGVIGSNNSLDFKMLLKLATGSNSLLGSLTSVSSSAQSKGIPFLVKGTTSSPVFLPVLGEAIKSTLMQQLTKGQTKDGTQQQEGLKGILGGLLNKKKTK